MSEQNHSNFETQLERLIEGAFAHLFSKTVRAQDIALQLARAMESEAAGESGDPRPLAPDHYVIRMHPDIRDSLLRRQPALAQILSQHMVELATENGYRLNSVPLIDLVPDPTLSTGDLFVFAEHINRQGSQTEVLRRSDPPLPVADQRPRNAQLIINGEKTVHLADPIVNIGRSRENHVVLDDPYISRHHAQIRLRFGQYTLFDVQSQTGTYVNDVRVREHRLQTGDVIRMGRMQMVYLEDDPQSASQTWAKVPDE